MEIRSYSYEFESRYQSGNELKDKFLMMLLIRNYYR